MNKHLRLVTSLTSPYGRKVRIVLAEKRIDYELVQELPWETGTHVPDYNPLGKVPALVLDDGTSLFDSRVIVDYLAAVTPVGHLIPTDVRGRTLVKRWEALADGLSDAAAAILIEKRREPNLQSPAWIDRQREKVERALAVLSRDLGERQWCCGEAYSLADIATGCALGFLDFRHPDIPWRERHPNLVALMERLMTKPAFQETVPQA